MTFYVYTSLVWSYMSFSICTMGINFPHRSVIQGLHCVEQQVLQPVPTEIWRETIICAEIVDRKFFIVHDTYRDFLPLCSNISSPNMCSLGSELCISLVVQCLKTALMDKTRKRETF